MRKEIGIAEGLEHKLGDKLMSTTINAWQWSPATSLKGDGPSGLHGAQY